MKKYAIVALVVAGWCLSGYGIQGFGVILGPASVQAAEGDRPAVSVAPEKVAQDLYSKDFYVYDSTNSANNQFTPSGWMGDFQDIKYNESYTGNCHVTDHCLQFRYDAKKSQGFGWAGVYWQHPINNWGNQPGGYNLMGMTKLTFWARGQKGGERIERFMVGGIAGMYTDSVKTWLGPVTLSSEWTKYTIDLTSRSLAYISGGFSWFAEARFNPDGMTFYLDDIRFQAGGGDTW